MSDALHILSHSAGSGSTVIQAALGEILEKTPEDFYTSTMDSVQVKWFYKCNSGEIT